MRRFILDTGIASLYLDRKRGIFERAAAEVANGNRVGIAVPILGELAFRAEGSPLRDRNLLRLRQALDVWRQWLVDTAAAFEYGRIAFVLKTIGRPIGQNDIMIAAVALSLGNTTVVTMDGDLAAIPGLTVENRETREAFVPTQSGGTRGRRGGQVGSDAARSRGGASVHSLRLPDPVPPFRAFVFRDFAMKMLLCPETWERFEKF